jgi:hypothetical protein
MPRTLLSEQLLQSPLLQCLVGAGRDAIAHAHKISNGGPPIVLIAEEEVVKLDGA